jgi:signal transduction histidine kinase
MNLGTYYHRLFCFIAKKRLAKGDVDPFRIHCHTVIVLSTSILMWAYVFIAHFTIASPVPGIVGLACAIIHLLSPLLFRVSSSAFGITNITIGTGIIHQATFSYYTGGFNSFILIWFGILPLLAGLIAGKKSVIFWCLLTTVWAGIYLFLHLTGYQFPNLISPQGELFARFFIVFGWIFLGSSITYAVLMLYEDKEKILTEQAQNIDDLFRVLFHDLAGPLSRISMGLKFSSGDIELAKKDHGIAIASRATEDMLEITQNVRKMYAVSKGKISSDLSYCPLIEAIEYVKKLYASDFEKKNIHLDFDSTHYRDLKVLVEPISFKNQVLGNVISNAIKFSPPEAKISIRAYPMNQQFHIIEIADQGIGMSPSLQESLFDINKKTSRPGTAGETGTGFGMHIMKSFMELYRGKIEIESRDETQEQPGTIIKLILQAEWNRGGSPLPE